MIYYLLVDSGSGNPITQFAWDEIASGSITGSFTPPSGTYLETFASGTLLTASRFEPTNLTTTGEFLGLFTGSLYAYNIKLNETNLNNLVSDLITYGELKIDTESTNVDIAPTKNYFKFDSPITAGEWETTDIKKVVLSNKGIDSSLRELNNIIDNKKSNVLLSFTHKETLDTWKKFKIVSASYYWMSYSGSNYATQRTWESDGLGLMQTTSQYVRDKFKSSSVDDFAFGGNGYYEIFVEEIESSLSLVAYPFHEDAFLVELNTAGSPPKTERYEFTSSAEITIPNWATKVTTICVGAGGGGGGGTLVPNALTSDFNGDHRELAIGGAGGQGGNVGYKTFTIGYGSNYDIQPDRKIAVTVGVGGAGGSRYRKTNNNTRWYMELECEYFGPYCVNLFSGYDGEIGGSSKFTTFSPSGKKIEVIGEGGNSGMRGLGIQEDIGWVELRRSSMTQPGYGMVTKNGEGITTNGSKLVGGFGGFGVSLIDNNLSSSYWNITRAASNNTYGNHQEYIQKQENKHMAPWLPMTSINGEIVSSWKNVYPYGPPSGDIVANNPDASNQQKIIMPYGYIPGAKDNEWKHLDGSPAGRLYTGSKSLPSSYAPAGGGGGTGDVSDDFATWYIKDINTNSPRISAVRQQQKIGLGGKNILNTSFYGIKFGDGGNGGNLVTIGGLPEVSPQSGSFPGGGGGGGSSIIKLTTRSKNDQTNHNPNYTSLSNDGDALGQPGAKGGDGLVVVIFEGN
jgi:hypothetical protein